MAVYNAAEQPLLSVASNEAARLGGHLVAYTLDALIPLRALRGFVRPSLILIGAHLCGAALSNALAKDDYHAFFRQQGQGSLHHVLHVLATGLRALHDWLITDGLVAKDTHDGMGEASPPAPADMGRGPADF